MLSLLAEIIKSFIIYIYPILLGSFENILSLDEPEQNRLNITECSSNKSLPTATVVISKSLQRSDKPQ